MEADKLTFLDEKPEAEPEVAEPAQTPEPEPKAAEPEGTGEPAEPPSAPERTDRFVPLTAILDEREKRQAKEREAEEYRRKLEALERQIAAQQQPQPRPSFRDAPDQALAASLYEMKLQQSRFLAEREYGKDTIEEAFAFFDRPENRALTHQFAASPSPFHAAVDAYKRLKTAETIGPDPDAYIEAQVEARLQQRLAQSVTPAPKAPPPSMARAPTAGRDAITPGSAFDQMLPR